MLHQTNTDNPIDFPCLDALGNPVHLGKRYGYSTSANGIARTVLGIAIKITKDGNVTLYVENVDRFLYYTESSDTVIIRPYMLFPV